MRTKTFNAEVLYPDEPIVTVNRADVAALQTSAMKNTRQRMRLCAHPGSDDPLHEMLIVLGRDTYIRPHKHINKSESFHVVQGSADIVLFNDEGAVWRTISLGDFASGSTFFYRLGEPRYHTVLVRSDVLVIHETTGGPFRREETLFAPWAPAEENREAVAGFQRELTQRIERMPG